MTIAVNNRNDYVGTGTVADYAYTFRVFEATDLVVHQRDLANIETVVNPNTYTVSGVGLANGGAIKLAANLPLNFKLSIRRIVDIVQETDLRNQSSFLPEVLEDEFDYLTMIDQQQQDEIDRSLKVSETSAGVSPVLPPPIPNALIAWNATATGLTSLPQPTGVPGGPLSIAGNIDMSGTINVGTDAHVTGDLTVGDDATISGDLAVSGAFTVNGVPLSGPAGAAQVGFLQSGASAQSRTVESVLREIKRASDFAGPTVANKINQAQAAAAVTGGVMLIPPTMGIGEGSPAPDNVLIVDLRGKTFSQGLRINVPALVGGDVRFKVLLQDNFLMQAIPNTHSATFHVASYCDSPDRSNGTIAAINGTQNVNTQTQDFGGVLVGIEGECSVNSTNATKWGCADARGGTFNCWVGGNQSVFRLMSLVAQAPFNQNAPTSSCVYAVGLLVENFVGVGQINYPFWCQGLARIDGVLGVGAEPFDFAGILVRHSTLTGANQFGIFAAPTTSAQATATGAAVVARADTAAAVFTQGTNAAFYVQEPAKGAGSTINLCAGLYISNLTVGLQNYAIYSLHLGNTFFSGPVEMTYVTFFGPTPTTGISGGKLAFGFTSVGTVGVAGTSAPLPSAPVAYLVFNHNGTLMNIPFYNHI